MDALSSKVAVVVSDLVSVPTNPFRLLSVAVVLAVEVVAIQVNDVELGNAVNVFVVVHTEVHAGERVIRLDTIGQVLVREVDRLTKEVVAEEHGVVFLNLKNIQPSYV